MSARAAALGPTACVLVGLLGSLAFGCATAWGQVNPLAPNVGDETAPAQAPMTPPPGGFKPDDAEAGSSLHDDVWIFSGELQSSHEPFSGTLVAGTDGAQFELKLADGGTCDGADLQGEVGFVRLKEITCSDGRSLKALFVPQGGEAMKVFGHVGDQRFVTSAHILGTEPIPDKPQTAEPKGPLGLPPGAPGP